MADNRFDSILVRLKELLLKRLALALFRFDSILVRLKVQARIENSEQVYEFRFHTGSIKRRIACTACFGVVLVSIPYWFD